MFSLEQAQRTITDALERGPAHLPPGLLAGSRDRQLLGMKVHANTIAHARLVALEETFPRCREGMGADAFLELARAYLDRPGTAALSLALIGEGFAEFVLAADRLGGIASLAGFEWAWLEAYNAADAEALDLAAIAVLEPDALLAMRIGRHPAARLCAVEAEALASIGLPYAPDSGSQAVLITRPEAEVRHDAASSAMVTVFAGIGNRATICNLLDLPDESGDGTWPSPDETMSALTSLISAGAIRQVE